MGNKTTSNTAALDPTQRASLILGLSRKSLTTTSVSIKQKHTDSNSSKPKSEQDKAIEEELKMELAQIRNDLLAEI